MANLNKVMLIGRLTRDPEPIQMSGSTAGAKFGFAVNNRKLNQQTQQWEEVPVFIDMEIWNRGESKQADRVLQTLRKGQQVFIEGHLKLDQWDDKNGGGKRTALRVVVEMFQYLEPRAEGESRPLTPRPAMAGRPAGGNNGGGRAPVSSYNGGGGGYNNEDDYGGGAPSSGGGSKGGGTEDDIPF